MKKLLAFTLILAAAAFTAHGAKTTMDASPLTTDMLMGDHKIIELTDKYLALLNSIYPEEAARAGMLGYQATLDPRTRQSEAVRKETMLAFQDTLNKINSKKLSPSKEISYQVLRELVNRKVFDITIANRLAKDPHWYLEALDSVFDILIKDYKPYQERLTDALKRLQALPAVLAQAKENLDNPPDLAVRVTLERAGVAYASFSSLTALMERMAADEYTKEQIKFIGADAKKALKEYYDFLKEMMDKKPYADFRLGADNFDKLMRGVYSINIPAKKMSSMMDKEVETTRAALISALTPIIEPALSDEEKEARITKKGVIEITPADYYRADAAYKKGPKYKDILNTFLTSFDESVDFFAKNDIFAPSNLRVMIAPAPKFLQNKHQIALYMPPFPLLARQFGDLLVALPDQPKNTAAVLPQFTYSKIKISAVENLSGGYNLMYGGSEWFNEIILKISSNPCYINGWVKYSLNTAKEKGYLVQDEDLIHIAWLNYKTALLASAEVKMQTGELNYTQSLENLVAAGMDKDEAATALDNAAMTPGLYLTAILGEEEFARLRVKYQRKIGAKFNMADFHRKMLSTGRVPLPVMERALDKAYEKKQVDSFFNTLYF